MFLGVRLRLRVSLYNIYHYIVETLLSWKYNPVRAECLDRDKTRIEWSPVGTGRLGRAAVVKEGEQVSRGWAAAGSGEEREAKQ